MMMLIRRLTVFSPLAVALLGAVVRAAPPRPPGSATITSAAGASVRTNPVRTTHSHRPRWIGVAVQAISPIFSHLLGLKSHQGLLVLQVIPGSPAQKAKLQAGDLLIQINGTPLLKEKQLVQAVNRTAADPAEKSLPGSPSGITTTTPATCRLVFIHSGQRKSVDIVPQVRPPRLMLLPNGRLVIAPANARSSTPPGPSNKTIAIGPGVLMHFGPTDKSSPGGPQWQHAVMVRQWIDRHGVRHVIMVFQGKNYPLHPQTIGALPPQIQPLARVILQRNTLRTARLSRTQISINMAIIQQRLKMLRYQQNLLQRQLQWLRRQLSLHPLPLQTTPAATPSH